MSLILDRDPSLLAALNSKGNSLLYHATQFVQFNVSRWLIEQRHIDVNIKSKNGMNALAAVAKLRSNEIEVDDVVILQFAQYYLERGMDPNAGNVFDITPLFWAAGFGPLELVKILVEAGAVSKAETVFDVTPLHRAVGYAQNDIVEYLIKYAGAKVNVFNSDGLSPLCYALGNGHFLEAETLLKYGADVNATAPNGYTVAHEIAKGDEIDSMRYLDRLGGYLEGVDSDGNAPIHYAAQFDSIDVAVFLVKDKGVNYWRRNKVEQRPLDVALEAESARVTAFLKSL